MKVNNYNYSSQLNLKKQIAFKSFKAFSNVTVNEKDSNKMVALKLVNLASLGVLVPASVYGKMSIGIPAVGAGLICDAFIEQEREKNEYKNKSKLFTIKLMEKLSLISTVALITTRKALLILPTAGLFVGIGALAYSEKKTKQSE